MELWVRSQENYEADITPRLIKVNNLTLDYEGKNDSYYIVANEGIEVAYYHSEKRALEVLNEIHQRLIDLQTIEIIKDSSFTKRNIDCVYEMPKE